MDYDTISLYKKKIGYRMCTSEQNLTRFWLSSFLAKSK